MIKRKYRSLAKMAMQHAIAYRASFLASILANISAIAAMFYLWKAIYSGREVLSGYTWEQIKIYLMITFVTNTLLSWSSEMAISRKILDGSVAMDLLKPIDFRLARLAETLGSSVFDGLIAIFLGGLLLALFAGIIPPSGMEAGVLAFFGLLLSLLTKFCIIYLFSLLCFWTSMGYGVAWGRAAITNFFSGALVPLAFFPEWLRSLALALPFKGIVHLPASLYLGRLTGDAALRALFLQAIWVALLWLAGGFFWRWAVRRVTIYGG